MNLHSDSAARATRHFGRSWGRCALALLLLLSAPVWPAAATVHSQTVEYQVGDTTHVGYMAYDDAAVGKRPGVLVVPEWWGLNDYARMRARQLAKAGYVAFAADMYGQGRTTRKPEQAKRWSGAAKGNLRRLTRAAMTQLETFERVDDNELAAIGFCFGGTSVLELAYSGVDMNAAVSLHGHLPTPADDDRINASILVLGGAADPFVPMKHVARLTAAYETRPQLDWHLALFGHAEHAFTNPDADDSGIDGVSYNAQAAKRAWAHTLQFLAERLEIHDYDS